MDSVYIEHVDDNHWDVKIWTDDGPKQLRCFDNKMEALVYAGGKTPKKIRIVERIEPVLPTREIIQGLKQILDDTKEICG